MRKRLGSITEDCNGGEPSPGLVKAGKISAVEPDIYRTPLDYNPNNPPCQGGKGGICPFSAAQQATSLPAFEGWGTTVSEKGIPS